MKRPCENCEKIRAEIKAKLRAIIPWATRPQISGRTPPATTVVSVDPNNSKKKVTP